MGEIRDSPSIADIFCAESLRAPCTMKLTPAHGMPAWTGSKLARVDPTALKVCSAFQTLSNCARILTSLPLTLKGRDHCLFSMVFLWWSIIWDISLGKSFEVRDDSFRNSCKAAKTLGSLSSSCLAARSQYEQVWPRLLVVLLSTTLLCGNVPPSVSSAREGALWALAPSTAPYPAESGTAVTLATCLVL